jgi:hypothetical protein
MSKRFPSAKWQLPAVLNPTDTVCYTVNVPNDINYIGAFLGAINDLTWSKQWQDDPTHKAAIVARVWQDIYDSLVKTACAVTCPVTIAEMEPEMSVCEQMRFNPATGLFEGLCCGVWSPISGQPISGFGTGGQPGGGTPQPAPGGGCQTYHMRLNGREQAVLPAPVNTGDTVIVSNMRGAWYDGSGVWNCPTGGLFFAGLCGPTSVVGTDPIPGGPHMALITKVGGVYHNISDGVLYTIPAAVSNLLLIFQANDSPISDDGGDISFDVTICNNQSAPWSHLLDFRLAPHGVAGSAYSFWSAGIGWKATVSGGFYSPRVQINLPTDTTINSIEYIGSTPATGDVNQVIAQTFNITPALILNYADTNAAGVAFTHRDTVLPGLSTLVRRIVGASWDNATGTPTIEQMIISGTGPQPVWP